MSIFRQREEEFLLGIAGEVCTRCVRELIGKYGVKRYVATNTANGFCIRQYYCAVCVNDLIESGIMGVEKW